MSAVESDRSFKWTNYLCHLMALFVLAACCGCNASSKSSDQKAGGSGEIEMILDDKFNALVGGAWLSREDWTSTMDEENFALFKKGQEKRVGEFGIKGDVDASYVYSLLSVLAGDAGFNEWVLFEDHRRDNRAKFVVTTSEIYRPWESMSDRDYEALMDGESEKAFVFSHQGEKYEAKSFRVESNDFILDPQIDRNGSGKVITVLFFAREIKASVLIGICKDVEEKTSLQPILYLLPDR